MASTITLVLGLLVATVVFASIATRLHIPYAILLVPVGALLGFVPGLPEVNLNPDVIEAARKTPCFEDGDTRAFLTGRDGGKA